MFDVSRQGRLGLDARLVARRGEIEEAVLIRALRIADPSERFDPGREEAMRKAIAAAFDYGRAGVLGGASPPLPPLLLARVRAAARQGVKRDTILRRYIAGQALIADLIVEEAEACGLDAGELRGLLRTQAALVDRLLAAVSEEHAFATSPQPPSAQRVELVERLLAGEAGDTARIAYDFGACHLGIAAQGPGCVEAVRALAEPLDRQLLLVRVDELTVWAWLGGRRPFDSREARLRLVEAPVGVSLAFGEPSTGLAGWRRTHRQARAALPIARLRPHEPTRYADVALVATIANDDLLASSLRELYLVPLQRGRDGGARALETLRAYFAVEGNASSAAAILGVSRRTVSNRLHAIETCLGCCLATCAMEVEAALRLEDLEVVEAAAHLAS